MQAQDNTNASPANRVSWYLDFHGTVDQPAADSVRGLTESGTLFPKPVLINQTPTFPIISEPRGMLGLSDGRLLLAAGRNIDSAVMVFAPPQEGQPRSSLGILTK